MEISKLYVQTVNLPLSPVSYLWNILSHFCDTWKLLKLQFLKPWLQVGKLQTSDFLRFSRNINPYIISILPCAQVKHLSA